MIKAVLQYSDFSRERKIIFDTLTANSVEVVKMKNVDSLTPKIIIKVKGIEELNKLVNKLNNVSIYGIKILSVRHSFFSSLYSR